MEEEKEEDKSQDEGREKARATEQAYRGFPPEMLISIGLWLLNWAPWMCTMPSIRASRSVAAGRMQEAQRGTNDKEQGSCRRLTRCLSECE